MEVQLTLTACLSGRSTRGEMDRFNLGGNGMVKGMDVMNEIQKGDLLISHKGKYHYLVEYIKGNKVELFWLHRKSGEPVELSTYRREINYDRAPTDYEVIPSINVNWSVYSNLGNES